MNLIELKNKTVSWLEKESHRTSTRPLIFTRKEIALALGDVPTSVGRVAYEACIDLEGRGISATYNNSTSPCKFVIK